MSHRAILLGGAVTFALLVGGGSILLPSTVAADQGSVERRLSKTVTESSFGQSSANYDIAWHVVAAGGGTSASGIYSVSGTVGEHDAGPTASGGSFGVAGGFWLGSEPTLVELVGFRAQPTGPNVVSVEWETASESDNAGFNLYRAPAATGPWLKLNGSLIPGAGTALDPHSYTYLDQDASNGINYYRLEDVSSHGNVASHGPIQVLVGQQCGAIGSPWASAVILLVMVVPALLPRFRGR